MMMEQPVVLKSDELQEKWKKCVYNTCYVYRMVERVKEVINHLHDVFRRIINSLAESLNLVFEELRNFTDDHEDFIKYMKSYPPSYPQYVNNFPVNTKGYPRPITHCARSRC